jgi:hypothetical protein
MANMITSTTDINQTSLESEDKRGNTTQESTPGEARDWQRRYAANINQVNMDLDNSLRLNTLPVAKRGEQQREDSTPDTNTTGHQDCPSAMLSAMRAHESSDTDATSTVSKARMPERVNMDGEPMNDMLNDQLLHANGQMPLQPDAPVASSPQADVHDPLKLCDDLAAGAEDDGVFELIFPSGQTLGVAVNSQPSKTEFLLSPSSSALGGWLKEQKKELANHLERRMQKNINITVL